MAHGKNPRVQYRCSFCGKSQEQVHRLVAGPGGVYICDECIDICRSLISEAGASGEVPFPGNPTASSELASSAAHTHRHDVPSQKGLGPGDESRCSFCGKSLRMVQVLIRGASEVRICDECVDLCLEIITEEQAEAIPRAETAQRVVWQRATQEGARQATCIFCDQPVGRSGMWVLTRLDRPPSTWGSSCLAHDTCLRAAVPVRIAQEKLGPRDDEE